MIDESRLRLALDELIPPGDEIADWDDVLARSTAARRRTSAPTRPILVAAACATLALGAIVLAGPWRAGPSIVDRAAAAITPPTAHEILYESIRIRVTAPRRIPPRLRSRFPILWTGTAHVWLDGAAPRRFRVTMSGRFRYASGRIASAPPGELGGTLDGFSGFVYDEASRTLLPVAFDLRVTARALDPALFIRSALKAHHATVVGSTTVDGRQAIRILVRARIFGRIEAAATYYVDAHTYSPIRVVISSGIAPGDGPNLPGMPLTSLTELQRATLPPFGGRYVFDFREYRHIPPSDVSRVQTNIRAVHPHAKIQ